MSNARLTRRLLAALLLLALAAPVLADDASDALVARGDRFYGSRGKGNRWCMKAIECYEKALALDPKSVAASWRIARASYWLGMHTEGDEAKLAVYEKGIEIAKRAIAIDGKSVESHFWLGVSYGKYGETKGVMNSLALVEPIRAEMKKVLELDESYNGGAAHVVLGRVYHQLPAVAGGSNEKAIEEMKKAIAIDDSHLISHLYLAEVYLDEGEKRLARKELEKVVAAPVEAGREPENAEQKTRAKELLAKLDGE